MLKEAGYLEEAAKAYRYAMEWDGTDTDAPLHLGHLSKVLGQLDNAIEIFDALTRIPHAPYVRPEIDALRIAKSNNRLFRGFTGQKSETASALPDALLLTQSKLDTRIAEEHDRRRRLGHQGASKGRCPATKGNKTIPVRLSPLTNLVIENDSLCATTANPQMKLGFVKPASIEDISASWVEFRVRIVTQRQPLDPVLFLERLPGWGEFFSVRLLPQGNDFFGATFYVPNPVFTIRLDPVISAGKFLISDASLRRLSFSKVLSSARQRIGTVALAKIIATAGCGWRKRIHSTLEWIFQAPAVDAYERWMAKYDHRKKPVAREEPLRARNSLGWLLPAGHADVARLRSTLHSFKLQEGDADWKLLVISDDGVPTSVRDFLHVEATRNPRLEIHTVPGKLDADEILALGSTILNTDYIAHIEAGDRLSPDALLWFSATLADNPGAVLVYCDHDIIDAKQRRHSPQFKPDWNFYYACCYDYIGRTVIFSAAALKQAGGRSEKFAGSQDFYVLLRAAAAAKDNQICHIPWPLWHCYEMEKENEKDIVSPVAYIAQTQHLGFAVKPGALPGTARLVWPLRGTPPHVTLIIPTRDRTDLLKNAVESILGHTAYPAFDIVIVDNGSVEAQSHAYYAKISKTGRVSVLRDDGPFNFSRLNNRAAALAKGSVLALVNNDVEAIKGDWLSEMVPASLDSRVGAVGAKLLYDSGHVQHAGIVGGIGSVAGHGHKYSPRGAPGYMNRLIVQQSAIAVTAACLVVEKKKFQAVGGFDEDNLRVAFNDVDLCLKLAERGWKTLFTPWAELFHHESISRGLDIGGKNAARFKEEADFMTKKWGDTLLKDRYYNPNLTRQYEDFSLEP
ncbi:hypothetical protein ASE23_29605 [Rhizobium sp. Root73]|nr:hypothetical protein ASD36_29555 [Rhizobium sp. Root1334]KRC02445.1 hypothetical protein ASE23_29605 [Rhizobium sp. Root73]